MKIYSSCIVFTLIVSTLSTDAQKRIVIATNDNPRPHFLNKLPPRNLKASVIIPCCAKHAYCLFNLVKLYANQTELPDEVIISLSESDKVDRTILNALQQEPWPFPVKLVLSQQKLYAGENRNVACSHADGDIYICQDADDIPHPQRVEIIKHFFNHYAIDHLMHEYFFADDNKPIKFTLYQDPEKIDIMYTRNQRDIYKFGRFTNGNVALTKELFEKIKWTNKPRGQDTEFNTTVFQKIKNRILIKATLLAYREYLSSSK